MTTLLFAYEIEGGDLVRLPWPDNRLPLRVVRAVVQPDHTSIDYENVHCGKYEHGVQLLVERFACREYRPRQRERAHVSHVHFPNGTVADTAADRLVVPLLHAALEISGQPAIDPYRRAVTLAYHRPQSGWAGGTTFHYVDPVNPAVTLCQLPTSECRERMPGESSITNCFTCEREAGRRRVGP